MDWRRNKQVGIAAAILCVAAAAIVVWWLTAERGPFVYLVCESTEEMFKVKASPDNAEYMEHYLGLEPGQAYVCKICDQEDAYPATRTPDGNWIKLPPEGDVPFEPGAGPE
ncbi:MAG: hypothetical protein ACYTAN_05370 [Planctomycetota bacterium]|jgi:hypothetical protein